MYKIALVNMPFASLNLPSIALTELKSVLDRQYGDRVSVEVLYLNHDFAHYLGMDAYCFVSDTMKALNTGLGDWVFRQVAFPEEDDNTEAYFRRFYPRRNMQNQKVIHFVEEKRPRLEQFLDLLIDKYRLEQADLVGFTSMFSQNVACFAMARKIKERNPAILTAMGGANCEAPMGQEIVKNIEHIDFVFSGPALKSFPELVQCQLNQDIEKCNEIKGVFSKKNCVSRPHDMTIGEELPIDVMVGLDYDPFLHAIKNSFPNGSVKPVLLFETSRGCWWGQRAHCTFCGLNGSTMMYRAMSAQKALEQFERLFKYSPQSSYFQSVDNIMPKNYPHEVFPLLKTPPNATLFYEVKADLTEEEFASLSRARVKWVQPGIEALATSTLKLMKKGTTVFQNLKFMKNCLLYGISPAWNLLIGFPGEDEQVYKKYVSDIPLLIHLPPPVGAPMVRFDRYSPYFVRAKEYGLDLHPKDFYQMIYPFSDEVLSNLAYFFMDLNFTGEYFKAAARWIDKIQAVVDLWQARWSGRDGALHPMLYFKQNGGSTVIYDSRSGEAMEYQIGSSTQVVLDLLSQPKKLTDIASHLNNAWDFELAKEMAFLKERRLVFQEDERFMSLVLPKQPLKLDSMQFGA
jgi:ribosomal peptide maturation radical SAM protein 1